MLLELYVSFFKVGLFSIGGGLVALPLIQNQVSEAHNWLSLTEFTDLVTIAQMTPGPIAINASTFVGTRLDGILGAVIATAGAISPSIIIVGILTYIYFKYKNLKFIQSVLDALRPAVVALISSAGLTIFLIAMFNNKADILGLQNINLISAGMFFPAIYVLRKLKKSPILVIFASGVIGGAIYLII